MARREAEAEIDVDVEARVLGDATQVEQLFLDLLSNALKFRTGAPRIRVQARLERERYLFSVRDDGIGIPPQHVERVFQMFERLHVRDAYPGIGLGLALCRRIVERHDGRLWVESDGQKGSTFWFTLPAAIGGGGRGRGSAQIAAERRRVDTSVRMPNNPLQPGARSTVRPV